MKKIRFLPLLAVLLLSLCITAFAASIPGQQRIISIADASGIVTDLTDDDASTAWIKSGNGDVDLTITLTGGSVGEIWIRSGYAYTQNWYNHYDRPDIVKVAVYYRANQYTTSYDVYRYRLSDSYQPHTVSSMWNSGYQRLILPKKYSGVSKIELTIESAVRGFGNAGVAISDIAISMGSHATATPKSYATSTPKPYIVYVTPTPGPYEDDDVIYITPEPDHADDSLVELITPKPTKTPYVELITPKPKPEETKEPIVYPSTDGIIATLNQRIATRSGPSNYFDEPGSFFGKGDEVKVFTRAYDSENDIWWFQVEFKYDNQWYRAYTPASRIDLNPDYVPMEPDAPFYTEIRRDTKVYFGPGTEYKEFRYSVAYEGYDAQVYCVEGDWAQIEYYDYATEAQRRGWVALNDLNDIPPVTYYK